jgi:hypothetical protein
MSDDQTSIVKRFRQRIDHGDVIQSDRGEFVLYDDYERLQRELVEARADKERAHG